MAIGDLDLPYECCQLVNVASAGERIMFSAEDLMARAAEIRLAARDCRDPYLRLLLLELADACEKLAAQEADEARAQMGQCKIVGKDCS